MSDYALLKCSGSYIGVLQTESMSCPRAQKAKYSMATVGCLHPTGSVVNYSQCRANNTSPVRITGMITLLDSPNKHKLQATQHTMDLCRVSLTF